VRSCRAVAAHVTRHIAHFNWATLVADLGDRRVAPFVNAVPKVNAMPKRSPGFVWRSGEEAAKGVRHRLAALHGEPRG
jgi:hypothetical protein